MFICFVLVFIGFIYVFICFVSVFLCVVYVFICFYVFLYIVVCLYRFYIYKYIYIYIHKVLVRLVGIRPEDRGSAGWGVGRGDMCLFVFYDRFKDVLTCLHEFI